MSEEDSFLIVDRLPLVNDLRAFVHPLKLGELKLKNGSIIEIKSVDSGKTIYAPIQAAISTNNEDNSSNDISPKYGFIQISRCLRINLQCFLGQKVKIKAVDREMIDHAECVVLAPIEDTISLGGLPSNNTNIISGTYADILFQFDFKNLPLKKNQVIPIYTLNRIIEFKVVIVQPTNVVIINDVDVIACRNTTVPRGNSPHFDDINYDDIGGLTGTISKIRQVIELPLLQPKLYRTIIKGRKTAKNSPIKGLLITANSGLGKSLISEAVKNETPSTFLRIDCSNLLTKTVEQAIAYLLKVIEEAVSNQPSIVFFDDFDLVALPEISENAQPDGRVSNALCSALKRLRDEKCVVVIAAARDDGRIRKDIKAKFDRKINIVYPIGDEKVSILRAIASRHPIDLELASEQSSAILACKTGAQIKNAAMRLIAKSAAELAFQLKSEKRRRKAKAKKKGRGGDDDDIEQAGNECAFSIMQLNKVRVSSEIVEDEIGDAFDQQQKEEDDLFEDTSFDAPEKFKPMPASTSSAPKEGRKAKKYDPQFEFYFSPAEPIRARKKGKGAFNPPESGFDFVDLFDGEPLYNEGISDGGKKRYNYDDGDGYYSDDDNRRPTVGAKKGKKANNSRKANRGRNDDYEYYYDDYYYDDYYYDDYYYSDDYDEEIDRRPRKNAKNSKKKPSKPTAKNRRFNGYSDDDEQEPKRQMQARRRIDPFDDDEKPSKKRQTSFPSRDTKGSRKGRNVDDDEQPSKAKKQADFPSRDTKGSRKKDFEDPFGAKPKKGDKLRMENPFDKSGAETVPRRKREREVNNDDDEDVAEESPFKSDEVDQDDSSATHQKQRARLDEEPKRSKKKSAENDGGARRRRNVFGSYAGENSDDSDDGKFGKVERKDPFANQIDDSSENASVENRSKKQVKAKGRNRDSDDDDDDEQQESGRRASSKKLMSRPVQRQPFPETEEEEETERESARKKPKNQGAGKKKNAANRRQKDESDDDDDEEFAGRGKSRNRGKFNEDDDDDNPPPGKFRRRNVNPFQD